MKTPKAGGTALSENRKSVAHCTAFRRSKCTCFAELRSDLDACVVSPIDLSHVRGFHWEPPLSFSSVISVPLCFIRFFPEPALRSFSAKQDFETQRHRGRGAGGLMKTCLIQIIAPTIRHLSTSVFELGTRNSFPSHRPKVFIRPVPGRGERDIRCANPSRAPYP